MLERIVKSFSLKAGEKLADYAQHTVKNIRDFKLTLETLEKNLQSLSAKASDVEEQIKNAELSGKRKRKREVDNWLTEVKSIETKFLQLENEIDSEGFISRFMGGGRAVQLNERIDGLVEQSRHFGELLLDVQETRGEALLTNRLVGKAFEENWERIWRLLVIDKVSRIGIHGMGGVGKTTLAKHIHNRLLEKTQECVIWVTVSQVFTMKKLQDEIAHVVGGDLSDVHNEDRRAARLYQILSHRKNCILILDDVWESINLEKVGYPTSVEGFKLIVTTRSLEVCRKIGCQEAIAVKTLQMDEAWNLFSDTFGKETKLAPQVEEIAKCMANLCDGLPLGILTLAGSMRGETEIHVWRNALEELIESTMGQDDMEEQVFKVLKYSFDRLSLDHKRPGRSISGYNTLQLCFLYCTLYTEDYKIEREELIRKFISEEFTDKRKSRKAQVDQAHSILDKLVNICLLESDIDHKGRDCIKMHDLVRAMALKITEHKIMVITGYDSLKEIPDEEYWTEDLEMISLMENDIEEIPLGVSPNCPVLSTLLLCRNSLQFLPNSFFLQMHGLCTLDLSENHIKELPNSLSDLETLKALLLENCRWLQYVPYLGKLKALSELDLSGTAIKQVPRGIEELVNLKFLSINAHKLEMFPRGLLLRFPNLQYLKFPYHMELPLEEIEKLKELEEFWGRVTTVCDFNRFITSGESRVYDTFYNIQIGSTNIEDFEGYNQVMLHEYNLETGEEKDETMLGQDIQHLIISECEGLSSSSLDVFPRLNNPIFLKSLEIYDCGGIECILTSDQQSMQSQFSALERIELHRLRDFKGVINKQEIGGAKLAVAAPRQPVFPSLRRLSISYCHKMKQLGFPASEFPNLEEIFVSECEEVEEIIQVADDGKPRGEGEARFITLPKLKELRLSSLPRLKCICNATMICRSVEKIYLKKCPTLKKLPLGEVPPPALKEISIPVEEKEWWESLEWENPTHIHLLQPFLCLDDGKNKLLDRNQIRSMMTYLLNFAG